MSSTLFERPALVIPLFAIAVSALLIGCWNAPFSSVDDGGVVSTALNVKGSFYPVIARNFMPVTDMSYRLDVQLAPAGDIGPDGLVAAWAPVMRVMNGVYHLIGAILLWFFLRRIGLQPALAFFISLVWASHPMACESVCWIAERKNILAGMFCFGALLAWTVNARWKWSLIYLLYALALFSKPSALGLLPVLIALEVLNPLQKQFAFNLRTNGLKLVLLMLVPVALSIVEVKCTRIAFGNDIVEPLGGSLFATLLTDVAIFSTYALHVLVPVDLSFFYGIQPITSLTDPRLWLYGISFAGFLASLIWLAEKEGRLLTVFGIIWFFGALGPNSNLVPTAYPMQDRFAYLATPGLWLALVLALSGLAVRMRGLARALPYAASAALLAMLLLSISRSALFQSDEALIIDAAMRQPLSSEAQLLAARFLAKKSHNAGDTLQQDAMTLQCYLRALDAPDLLYHENELVVRTRIAEICVATRQFSRARKVLEGWLPPQHMQPFESDVGANGFFSRRQYYSGYPLETLAHAYSLMAEADLQESNLPGLDKAQRLVLCKRGIQDAESAMKTHQNGYRAHLIKARVLMQMAYLIAEDSRAEEAKQFFAQGQEILKNIPAESESGNQARSILAAARPPR